ncbi:MAG TPA: NAD(+) kinase [candidate division Zixibacteria bacterium]|nr:NAD(+) kinase [candidate division Zixibacteria bacterium]
MISKFKSLPNGKKPVRLIVMKLGVIANLKRPHAQESVERVIKWCRENKQEFFLVEDLVTISEQELPLLPREELPKRCNYIISMGGDGTMLATSRLVADTEVPILGINLGSLGFLTEQTPQDLELSLKRIQNGNFKLEKRMVLEARFNKQKFFALNEFVVDKGKISRMISLSLSANGDYICSYNADGLIISSPTGSTAYSLAVGGPILNPKMRAMIASPIAPHSLASRPLIFPKDDILDVRIDFSHEYAILTADGQVDTNLPTGSTVSIRVADHAVRLIRFPENSFYAVLRSKLHWGVLPKRSSE